jgi:hypothetical protein
VRGLAAAFLIAGACSDPSLQVTIDLPDAYRAQIAEVALADYEHAGLTCDQIAFGDVAGPALDGSLITQVGVAPGASASLEGISRLDHKVLVARGFDAGGDLVVAGCRELDALDGSVTIAIDTMPAALVSIDARAPDAPLALASPINAHALDPLGMPLDQREVVWRVFGGKGQPGGMPGDGACPYAGVDGCTTSRQGAITVAAAPPPSPGPALVQVHVAWARAQPPPVAAFQIPRSATFVLRAVLKAVPYPSCVAYRAAGGVRVACIAVALGGATEVQHFGWTGSAIAKLAGSISVPSASALIAIPGGSSDTLVAITTAGDFVDGTTGAALGHFTAPGAQLVVAAQLVPACGKTAFVLLGLDDGSVASTSATGAPLTTFVTSPPSRTFSLATTGCLSDLITPSTTYRAAVMVETKTTTSVPYAQIDCPQGTCAPTWLGLGAGIGFVAAAGGETRLASGHLDLSGVVIDESLIDPSHDSLESVATHDSISVPVAIASGDLDGDGMSDRAWLLLGGSGVRAQGRLQVTLAATADGAPITGISPELGAATAGFAVARLDDDMTDDVAVFSADQVTIVLTGKQP